MADPVSVPTSINFTGAVLYDDRGNFVSVASGSLALKVAQTSTRPLVGEYSAGITLVNGSASAQNIFSIENPVGSGKFVIVRKLGVGGTIAATANALFGYRLGRNNSFPTGGSAVTATKRQTSDSNPVAVVRSSPAGSVTNNMWISSPGTYVTAVGHMAATTYMAIDALDDEGDVVLAPGEALIMVADNNDTDWRHYGFVRWQEST